jgi:hypothetical protein
MSLKVPVTAEAAGSSPVVPAIHSKRLVLVLVKPLRTQKGTFSCPFSCPFSPRRVDALTLQTSPDDDDCDSPFGSRENANDKSDGGTMKGGELPSELLCGGSGLRLFLWTISIGSSYVR